MATQDQDRRVEHAARLAGKLTAITEGQDLSQLLRKEDLFTFSGLLIPSLAEVVDIWGIDSHASFPVVFKRRVPVVGEGRKLTTGEIDVPGEVVVGKVEGGVSIAAGPLKPAFHLDGFNLVLTADRLVSTRARSIIEQGSRRKVPRERVQAVAEGMVHGVNHVTQVLQWQATPALAS